MDELCSWCRHPIREDNPVLSGGEPVCEACLDGFGVASLFDGEARDMLDDRQAGFDAR